MNTTYTLRVGDMVEYAGQRCRIVRVTDCAAVVAVIQKPRTITPRFTRRRRHLEKIRLILETTGIAVCIVVAPGGTALRASGQHVDIGTIPTKPVPWWDFDV